MNQYYNRKYFDEMKVGEMFKMGFRPISINRLKGLNIRFQGVYENFADNLNASLALGAYTGMVGVMANYLGYRLAYAVFKETASFNLDRRFSKAKQTDIELSRKEVNRQDIVASEKRLAKAHDTLVRELIDYGKRPITDGMDVIIRAMIIFAWTTFETLCEDLLEKTIDIRPKTFAVLKGRNQKRAMPAWEGTDLKGKVHPFSDVKRMVGRSRLTYRSVKAIRDSYWLVFHKNYGRIDRIIKHRSIDNLHAVRNVLVHKGGIVDQPFLDRIAGVPQFSKAQDNALLHLDFAMVKWLIRPVFARGISLIVAVNRWVREHPDA